MNELINNWGVMLIHSFWLAAIFLFMFKLIDWLSIRAANKRITKIVLLGVFVAILFGIFIHSFGKTVFIKNYKTAEIIQKIIFTDVLAEQAELLNTLLSFNSIVVYIWFTGILFGLCKALVDWRNVYQIEESSLPIYSQNTKALINEIIENTEIKRKVNVFISPLIDSPMTIGILRPIIYFPTGILSGLSPAEIEIIIEHELAHIRRYDYLINIGLISLEKIFFFNPFIWQLTRSVRKEMEFASDDDVIKNHKEVSYAKLLYQLQIFKMNNALPIYFSDSKDELSIRIQRILKNPKSTSNLGLISIFSIGLLLLLVSFTFLKEEKINPHNIAKVEIPISKASVINLQDTLQPKKEMGTIMSKEYAKIEPFLTKVKSELIKDGLLSAERPKILLMFQYSDVLHGKKVLGKYYQKYKNLLNEHFPVYDSFATTRLFVYKPENTD